MKKAKKVVLFFALAVLTIAALSACAPAPRPDVNYDDGNDVTPNGTMYRDMNNDATNPNGINGWRRTNVRDVDNDGVYDNRLTRPMTDVNNNRP